MRSPNLFVTSTHTPVLFFSTHGKVYRLKVWRLPEGAPQARGRPMVNLLPLAEGETISTVLPLARGREGMGQAPRHVRDRQGLGAAQFDGRLRQHPHLDGKIAMRFEEGSDDRLIGVSLLTEEDDVLLATRNGKAIRFAATDVREFQSRDLDRRARRPADRRRRGDLAVDPARLRGDHRGARRLSARRALEGRREGQPEPEQTLSAERMAEFAEAEEFILTVCANGYGKRSSAYEYRRTNRGGQGITNIDNLDRNGPVVASFPAHNGEQLMLVTDQAKLIRMSVGDTRVIGRNSAGVRLFNVADDEHVVSAARIEESEEEAEADLGDDEAEIAPSDDATIGEDLADGGESTPKSDRPRPPPRPRSCDEPPALMGDVQLRPFETKDTAGIIDLILAIQREEFGLAITSVDQPDLYAIPDFYLRGRGAFLVRWMTASSSGPRR